MLKRGILIIFAILIGLAVTPVSAQNGDEGIYLIFNSLTAKRCISPNNVPAYCGGTDSQFNEIKTNNRLDSVRGISYRVGWNLIEASPDAYDWDYLIEEIRYINSLKKSDGITPLNLKVELNIEIVGTTPDWLSQSPYNVPLFYYKDPVGGTSYNDASISLPWDSTSTYRIEVKDLLTDLQAALSSGLTAAEYASITEIGVNAPAGAKDYFLMPLGQDNPATPGACETRSEATTCASSLTCSGNTGFIHNYETEWTDNCFTSNRPYTATTNCGSTEDYLTNNLFMVHNDIEDHLSTTFPTKNILRTVHLTNLGVKSCASFPISRDVFAVLQLIINDSLDQYGDRYMLQIDALKSGDLARYDYDNVLEKGRVLKDGLISYEMVWASANPTRFCDNPDPTSGCFLELRNAFILGLNRGAKAFRIYMAEITDSGSGIYVNDHLSDFDFVYNFYNTDYSSPTDITDLSASIGASPGEVNLVFTPPADDLYSPDGPVGVVESYIIKYSQNPILSEADFNDATEYIQSFVPSRVGINPVEQTNEPQENLLLSGLPSNANYIAIRSKDDAEKLSDFATVSVGCDVDATTCSTCGYNWIGRGKEANCCGDDTDENYVNGVCCTAPTDTVENGRCVSTQTIINNAGDGYLSSADGTSWSETSTGNLLAIGVNTGTKYRTWMDFDVSNIVDTMSVYDSKLTATIGAILNNDEVISIRGIGNRAGLSGTALAQGIADGNQYTTDQPISGATGQIEWQITSAKEDLEKSLVNNLFSIGIMMIGDTSILINNYMTLGSFESGSGPSLSIYYNTCRDEDADCSMCTSLNELVNYATAWLNSNAWQYPIANSQISQQDLTIAIHKWLNGISTC